MAELYTLTETAQQLKVSKRTVERLIAAGRLRTIAIGRRRLVTEKEIDAFVAASRARLA